MPTQSRKERIAILGGGMAALTTAFELSKTQELRDRYEVTIYQMGWRLGGKCATGRGPQGRIEEHGIHGFSGSYFNAFGLMRDCYAALPEATRAPDGRTSVGVLKSFEDAFNGVDRVLMWEVIDTKLHSWPFFLAPNALSPLTYDGSMALVRDLARGAADLLALSRANTRQATLAAWIAGQFSLLRAVLAFIPLLFRAGVPQSMVHTFIRWFDPRAGRGAMAHRLRRLFMFSNFILTLYRGLLDPDSDILLNGFDSIDEEDYRDWLKRFHANDDTLDSSLVYNTIDLSYAYPNGDTTLKPKMGAGTYLRWTLRSALNLGSFIWAFEAGTGETLIAPLYHVLKHQGVKFQFFSKVTALRLSDDQKNVAEIDIDVQANLKPGLADYDPLIWCRDLLCWPSQPKFECLAEGEELNFKTIDLESYWSPWNDAAKGRTKTLKFGEDQDFDKVVFAISIGAVEHICQDIFKTSPAANEAWGAMVENVKTCPTQTMQIWLTKKSGELGASKAAGGDETPDLPILSGTFVQPFNGQVDFSNLLKYENWSGPNPPAALWYFSGAMAEDLTPGFQQHDFPDRQHDRTKHQSIQFLQATVGYLLPWSKATWSPLSLDFSLLHTQRREDEGVKRFERQFWRANIDPTERYVLSPAGSTRHRLEAHESGFDNLILAGDWIYNGMNVGSVEGAVMGGRLAAHAVCGSPDTGSIYGYRRRGS